LDNSAAYSSPRTQGKRGVPRRRPAARTRRGRLPAAWDAPRGPTQRQPVPRRQRGRSRLIRAHRRPSAKSASSTSASASFRASPGVMYASSAKWTTVTPMCTAARGLVDRHLVGPQRFTGHASGDVAADLGAGCSRRWTRPAVHCSPSAAVSRDSTRWAPATPLATATLPAACSAARCCSAAPADKPRRRHQRDPDCRCGPAGQLPVGEPVREPGVHPRRAAERGLPRHPLRRLQLQRVSRRVASPKRSRWCQGPV
jgi:hypothetical protein